MSDAFSFVALSYEVGDDAILFGWEAVLGLIGGDGLDQPGHIAGKGAHLLQPLSVLLGFAGEHTVDAVPVLTGGDRHTRYGKKLVELVVGGRDSATTGDCDRSAHLEGLRDSRTGTLEKAGHKSDQGRVGAGVVHGRGQDQAVRLGKQGRGLVDEIVKDTLARLAAGAAGDTAADILVADRHDGRLDAFLVEDLDHLLDGQGRVAAGAGGTVE